MQQLCDVLSQQFTKVSLVEWVMTTGISDLYLSPYDLFHHNYFLSFIWRLAEQVFEYRWYYLSMVCLIHVFDANTDSPSLVRWTPSLSKYLTIDSLLNANSRLLLSHNETISSSLNSSFLALVFVHCYCTLNRQI